LFGRVIIKLPGATQRRAAAQPRQGHRGSQFRQQDERVFQATYRTAIPGAFAPCAGPTSSSSPLVTVLSIFMNMTRHLLRGGARGMAQRQENAA
jgi:hypothetical protein